jgi:hypothetical protein
MTTPPMWWHDYRPAFVRGDLIAGPTVWAVLVLGRNDE